MAIRWKKYLSARWLPQWKDFTKFKTTNVNITGKGCSPNPCGTNGMCRESVAGFLVCTCPAGYSGDPFIYCHRAECLDHTECRNDMACRAGSCVNPCVGTCGVNSNCDVIPNLLIKVFLV